MFHVHRSPRALNLTGISRKKWHMVLVYQVTSMHRRRRR